MRWWICLAGMLVALGCRDRIEGDPPGVEPVDPGNGETDSLDPDRTDADNDGFNVNDDCDDTDAAVNPGADEVPYDGVDNDCDSATPDDDIDGDSFPAANDCNDGDASINPDAPEICDGIDNDCDGTLDDAPDGVWYADADADGFGDPAQTQTTCAPGSGLSAVGGDCDDGDAAIYPGAVELCDGIDNDCDGSIDLNPASAPSWYADVDGDGYGDPATAELACAPPGGYVADGTDCDDAAGQVHPGADERCNGVDDDCEGSIDLNAVDATSFYPDGDADGWGDANAPTLACSAPAGFVGTPGDCDDALDIAYPGNTEICDGVDNNCDTRIDEDGAAGGAPWYRDLDGDTFGDPNSAVASCGVPAGYVVDNTDCDDVIPTVYPGAVELCDGLDNDCDLTVDEGATQLGTWYADGDGDGFGDLTDTLQACARPPGYVGAPNDCDDTSPAVFPGAVELCNGIDDDCDNQTDESSATDAPFWYLDADRDGFGFDLIRQQACTAPFGFVANADDCADLAADTYPGAPELCDGRDNDCDLVIDNNPSISPEWYLDADGDGYGNPAINISACIPPADYVDNADDCDDTQSVVRPGGVEICNGVDDDCDGTVDDSTINPGTWYPDGDGDGYGRAAAPVTSCAQPPGHATTSDDCNDTVAAINPGAVEVCDTVDNDCDNRVDEPDAADAGTWYADTDADGYGNAAVAQRACVSPAGHVADNTDCFDADAAINPGASEVCDGLDNDCDRVIDDNATGGIVWYPDGDGDGYGDLAAGVTSCQQPAGTTRVGGDCDDANANISPARTEVCDAVDNDCSGVADDNAVDAVYWAIDADGDGYGNPATLLLSCSRPAGYAGNRTDCDDTNRQINPRIDEVCNGIDDDCDGRIDFGAIDAQPFFLDGDADGFGNAAIATIACAAPAGYTAAPGDCDDGQALSFPGNTEVCDGVDNNCLDGVDEAGAVGGGTFYRDVDGDGFGDTTRPASACGVTPGFAVASGDCNDRISTVYPGAVELCDGLDNDCDSSVDEGATQLATWYADQDGDGFGTTAITQQSCAQPDGYVAAIGDCDDLNITAFPGALEYCNGYDDDCNGAVDEATAVDAPRWFLDFDGDAYGGPSVSVRACVAPAGFVDDNSDCADGNADSYPGAVEICDGLDNDCNLLADDGAVSTVSWFPDLDGDGYGAGTGVRTCAPPPGHVANADDCDDSTNRVRPGGVELCNGVDDDCDLQVDEGALNPRTWYADTDGDTWGADATTQQACAQPAGFVARNGDCDDTRATDRPGAPELCDLRDNDCDGATDESAVDALTWYADADGDTFGNPLSSRAACAQPAGFVANDDDCGDGSAAIRPGAPELCDGLDNDCDNVVDDGAQGAQTWYADVDGDRFGNPAVSRSSCSQPVGYVADDRDCDDTRITVNPSRTEVCDGLDNDCDGAVDDAAADGGTWYADGDGDGYGRVGATLRACSQPSGYAAVPGDCNDGNGAIRPGATEVCDGVDNDCNGTSDVGAADAATWFRDADADTYGNPNIPLSACVRPAGYVADNTDCADNRGTTNPGAAEICDGLDNDCSGVADDNGAPAVRWYADDDNDAYGDAQDSLLACTQPAGYLRDNRDCDDTNAAVRPNAAEVCDGLDNDCDAQIDEGAAGASAWWRDDDVDGFGDPTVSVTACAQPQGYVANDDDCDDSAAAANPLGVEICDSLDNDCDGTRDNNAADATVWFRDGDRDTYGDAASSVLACSRPTNYVANDDDCDDGLSSAFPGAPERCDGVDNDCNGQVDDGGVSTASWYLDSDADGFGNPAQVVTTCSPPAGYVLNNGDCNDTNPAVRPGAPERCNNIDDDCSGAVDDGAIDGTTFYADADNDTYGAGLTTVACARPAGFAARGGDCNDASAAINPGAAEVCDGADNNCDGTSDVGAVDALTWYRDADGDAYGNADFTRLACSRPAGFVADATDCLDASNVVFPGAPELCDGLDNDCDNAVDDGAAGARSWYRDNDRDGFGDPAASQSSCAQPSGFVSDNRDCNDAAAAVNPSAVERCDGVDNNCDNTVDTDAIDRVSWYTDGDGDTYGTGAVRLACTVPPGGALRSGDCNDAAAATYPGAPEVCDGVDNDCNNVVDGPNPVGAPIWYLDFDRDGRAGSSVTLASCTQPPNHYATATDCNDGVATAYPGAPELCDGIDNDCDNVIDDNVVNPISFYIDGDGDGYGGAAGSVQACLNPGGYVSTGGDCNDANPAIRPGASEFCDGVDNNCDNAVDEATAVDALTWYLDADGDLFGNATRPRNACARPSGHVADNTDCDDLTATNFPGATERCDGADNDCDRVVDEPDAINAQTWYFDADNDGYGIAGNTTRQCVRPGGFASQAGDCDDTRTSVNPGATEVCDTRDNNCNGITDGSEAVDANTYYIDNDRDGFGNAAVSVRSCSAPSGYVSPNTDCNDARAATRPGASEACNGIDDNCSGLPDDAGASCPYTVYHYGSHAYFYGTSPLPWTQARDYCTSWGYHLITLNELGENFWANGIADYLSEQKWWTGFNDLQTEGQWRWVTGEPVTYTAWAAGEPNNVYNSTWNQDEDCMQFNRYGDGTWNDEWCAQSFRFVCEAGN